MTWIKLEDNAVDHPKISGLSDRAFRAWVRSLSYASRFLTDGALPVPFLATVARKVQDEIMDAGLWLIAANGAVSIHDYLEHQTSKAVVEKERRRNRDRRAGRTNGTPTGRTEEKPRPEVHTDEKRSNPQPPSDEGGFVRIRREHRENAKTVLRAQQGYCRHDQPCVNQAACCERLALEIALKAKAS